MGEFLANGSFTTSKRDSSSGLGVVVFKRYAACPTRPQIWVELCLCGTKELRHHAPPSDVTPHPPSCSAPTSEGFKIAPGSYLSRDVDKLSFDKLCS